MSDQERSNERRAPGRHAAIVGPTASGKTELALAIVAADAAWEIVTVDSMQVYRGMDIGTAKATSDEQAQARHHLLDVADPRDEFDVATYQLLANEAIDEIEARGGRALLVGGTALYLRAVIDDLEFPGQFPAARDEIEAEPDTAALHSRLHDVDPTAASRMEPTNRRRIVRALEVCVGSGRPFSSFGPGLDRHPPTPYRVVTVDWPRPTLDRRIEQRYAAQLEQGFVDEVRTLVAHGMSRSASQALGYKELAEHLSGQCALDTAIDLAIRRTRRFARRQERWLRRDPRIVHITAPPDPEHVSRILDGAAD